MARIGVFGAGYVGLVTGACFADLGHEVVVRDILDDKIEQLDAGRVPIHEPGLDELIARNAERLAFTTSVADAVEGADFVFVAVGTPPTYAGDADLSAVWTVVEELPRATDDLVLVMKSTVPVGTGEKIRAALDQRGLANVGYVSNPEFTAEGRAVRDFTNPDRIVIGAFDAEDGDRVEALHSGIDAPVVRADVNSAEMIKLASNAFLSTRISFVNEIANVCELVGADVQKVAEGMGLDHRLGPHFLRAGIGFGGSCFDGRETLLVRLAGRTWLSSFAELYEQATDGLPLEVVSWRPDGRACFEPIAAITRRAYSGTMIELRTKMGRRVRVTADHPIITRDGVKRADETTTSDWVPLALGEPANSKVEAVELDVLADVSEAGVRDVIARVPALAGVSSQEVRQALPDVPRARSYDVLRNRAVRLHEADALAVDLDGATYGTAKNGTFVPATMTADERFWRVVGLYIPEGHVGVDGGRRRIQWSFHPYAEGHLVGEVADYWRGLGIEADVREGTTSTSVVVSLSLLADFWLGTLGVGANCYTQRIPDAAWTSRREDKRALLSGLWAGDGSWSFVAGGPSVVLEYGTVSRELADGILRLLGELGIVARLRVGRTGMSTVDTFWLVIAGAAQIEQMLELVDPPDREVIEASLARQKKRTAPTGYRREGSTAWVRVVGATSTPFEGDVYSIEVPTTGTVVTTAGVAVHNCFPKDVSALKQLAGNSGYHFQLLSAVIEVNELQKRRVISKLQRHLGRLRGKKIALLGLAFKPGTDDTREAPSLVLASRLIAEGAEVRAWDPIVDAVRLLPQAEAAATIEDAVRGADAAVIVTEWDELQTLARPEIRELMARPLIVDGRNLLDPAAARAAGFAYEGMGRPVSPGDVLPETPERQPELEA